MGSTHVMTLEVAPGDLSDDALDHLVNDLRAQLLDLDVDDARVPDADAPTGARSAGAIALGSLVVTMGRDVVAPVIRFLTGWARRGGGRRVEITIDGRVLVISDATPDQQDRLITAYIEEIGA